MIPILFESNEINFTSNGLGRLSDAISCEVKEQRNGMFELELSYPISGIHFQDIDVNKIIFCKTEPGGNNQQFIIYKRSKPLNGIVTFNAQHVSYLLNSIPCMPFEGSSLVDTMSKIPLNAAITCPFTFSTDIESSVNFTLEEPREIRSLLGGERGSILDVYGQGDYKFDNYQVSLLADRGNDNGVSIRYGKNLTDLEDVLDSTSTYTGICPYWRSSEGDLKTLPEKVIYSPEGTTYPYKIIRTIDFSGDFQDEPTDYQLRARAEQYINSNKGWRLKNNLKVSFISLYDTEEYKNIAPLERVRLCDTVHIVYENIDVKAKIIETNFDVFQEQYTSIELGDTTYSLAQAVAEAAGVPTEQQVNSRLQKAIEHATKLIQGGLGGHVVFNTNANGEPEEILIMDTDSIETAVNVIRMNLGGIGFSHNGYSGPFETAWTIDGHFVANYIDTGTLDGGLIRADTIQANSLSVSANSELGTIYEFVPIDWNNNISRWAYNLVSPSLYQTTLDGVAATALDLTSHSSTYTPGEQTQFNTNYAGKLSIHFEVLFNIYSTSQPGGIIADQQFIYIYYPDSSGNWWTEEVARVSGEYIIQPYDRVSSKLNKIEANINLSHECDPSKGNPKIGFRFIANTDTEIFSIKAYAFRGDFMNTYLKFNANGLESVVQEGNIISSINQSAEQVTIQANKIDLTGNLSLKGDFSSNKASDPTSYAYINDSEFSIYMRGDAVFRVYPYYGEDYRQVHLRFYDPDDFYYDYHKTVITPTAIDTQFINGHTIGAEILDVGDGQGIGGGWLYCFGKARFYSDMECQGNVYDSSGSIVFVSDKRKKKNIKDLAIEKARSFIMALKPREFKFKKPISTSDRKHHGFIAQEVKEIMPEDFGIYVHNEEKDFIGLRYDEFIADIVAVVQDQQKRIEELERRLNDITNNKS